MKAKKVIKKILISLALVLFFAGAGAVNSNIHVIAKESGNNSDATSTLGLQLSLNYLRTGVVEPGKRYTQIFEVKNTSNSQISFEISVLPLSIANETYEYSYTESTDRTKITEWISFLDGEEYTLSPLEKETIRIRIKVPDNAASGGQYAAIAININSDNEDTIAVQNPHNNIFIPVYATVGGDIVYKGNLTEQNLTIFSLSPTIDASSTIKNTGNADFEAKYQFTVSSFWGEDIIYEDTQTKVILPSTEYEFNQTWSEAPTVGILKTSQEITYVNESGQQAISQHKRVSILCPLWLIIVTLTLVILTPILIILIRKKSRKAKQK